MSSEAPSRGEEVAFDFLLGDDSLSFEIDQELYPLDAIYGAAYLFIDRCYVFLTRSSHERVGVRLKARETSNEEGLETLAGDFANELLNQVVRLRVGESTARIREYYMARALAAGSAQPSIDELLKELESEDFDDDPLDIMVPWEEKHAEGGEQTGDE